MFHIKSIWDKFYFHPFFYFIMIISVLTGHFKNLLYFTSILIIHECGHSLVAIILGIKVNKIEIYPYGGCSRLEYDINISLVKELLVIIAGPIVQIGFTFLMIKLNFVDRVFLSYSKFILFFNLLPIYPLDGGKLLNTLLSLIISFYYSLKIIFYFSYFVFISLFFINVVYLKNLFYFLMILSLGLELYKEFKNINIYFNKFLLERYIKVFQFNKLKRVNDVYHMKRDYLHVINNVSEREYLAKYFNY